MCIIQIYQIRVTLLGPSQLVCPINTHVQYILYYIRLLSTFALWRQADEYLDQKDKTDEDDDGVDCYCYWVREAEHVLQPCPTLFPENRKQIT